MTGAAADPGNTAVVPPALLVDRASTAVTGTPAELSTTTSLTPVLHHGTGTALAVGYFLAARRWPGVTTGFGAAAGAAAFLATRR